jgi:hypothetical protein
LTGTTIREADLKQIVLRMMALALTSSIAKEKRICLLCRSLTLKNGKKIVIFNCTDGLSSVIFNITFNIGKESLK